MKKKKKKLYIRDGKILALARNEEIATKAMKNRTTF
jgi:predicted amidohydrolase YtcJ